MADLETEGRFAHCAEPVRLATRWVERHRSDVLPTKGLFFHGPNGTGKTSVAAAIAVELDVLFWDVRCLIAQAKSEFNATVQWPVVERCVRAPVMVLDDVGVMRNTEFVVETVRDILSRRHDRCHLTVVTSNLDPDGIGRLLGPAVHSRLLGDSVVVPVVGEDARLVTT